MHKRYVYLCAYFYKKFVVLWGFAESSTIPRPAGKE